MPSSQSFREVEARQGYVFFHQILSSDKYVELRATGYEYALSETPNRRLGKRRLVCKTLILFEGEEEVGKIRFKGKLKWESGVHNISNLEDKFCMNFKRARLYTDYSQ
jgi:hypothetical protein